MSSEKKRPKDWPDPEEMRDRRDRYAKRFEGEAVPVEWIIPTVLRGLPEFRKLDAEYRAVKTARDRVVAEQRRFEAERDQKMVAHQQAVRDAVARGDQVPPPPEIPEPVFMLTRPVAGPGSAAAAELARRGLPNTEVVNVAAVEYDDMLRVITATTRGILRDGLAGYRERIAQLARPAREKLAQAERALAEARAALEPFERADAQVRAEDPDRGAAQPGVFGDGTPPLTQLLAHGDGREVVEESSTLAHFAKQADGSDSKEVTFIKDELARQATAERADGRLTGRR